MTAEPISRPWPTDLVFDREARALMIAFDDGEMYEIPFELLRVESPSAETKGHGSETPPPPARKRKVGVTGAEPVGRYALRIKFDDGHNTGLYTWAYLRELGEQTSSRMAAYLGRLKEFGLSRE